MLKPVVKVMVKAARLGGNVLVRHMNKLDALNVVEKDRMDYASEVDGLAEEAIVKELRKAYPECAVLGEEGGLQKGGNARGPGALTRATWVIDPLDGTSAASHAGSCWSRPADRSPRWPAASRRDRARCRPSGARLPRPAPRTRGRPCAVP